MDPYVVLGVDPGASPDEIDHAYARRRRLHDPTKQATESDRSAAQRFHAELADAYRALLGTAPPSTGGRGGTGSHLRDRPNRDDRAMPVCPRKQGPSPGRDVLVVLGTLVGAYVAFQVPVALGFGFGGLIIGLIAAVALVAVVLAHEHSPRT